MRIHSATSRTLPRPPNRRSGRAFTLIEVLIATFIFALGLLGLLALFAGAAIQQQEATRVTNSVLAGNAAEAIVAKAAGRIEYRDNNNQVNPAQMNALLRPGQWRILTQVVMYPNDDDRRFGYLTLRPRNTPTGAKFFFVVPALEPLPLDLYVRPASQSQNGQGIYSFSANQLPFSDGLRQFATARVHRESLSRLEVVTEEANALEVTNVRRIIYTPRTDLPPGYSASSAATYLAFSPSSSPGTLVDRNDYIVIHLAEPIGHQQPQDIPPRARIDSMRIGDVQDSGGTRRVASIRVPFYEWRNDRLVSLPDRVTTRQDDSRDDGRRPVLAYSMLYRRTASGASQVAVFTYSLRAPTAAAQFIPQETEVASVTSPLTSGWVRLGYDDERKQYYIERRQQGLQGIGQNTPPDLKPGAIYLIEGANSGTPAGSDLPVRVVEAVDTDDDGEPDRGYLDRGPRAQGESYLSNFTAPPIPLRAWRVAPSIESVDGSTWTLEPVDARVLQTD